MHVPKASFIYVVVLYCSVLIYGIPVLDIAYKLSTDLDMEILNRLWIMKIYREYFNFVKVYLDGRCFGLLCNGDAASYRYLKLIADYILK